MLVLNTSSQKRAAEGTMESGHLMFPGNVNSDDLAACLFEESPEAIILADADFAQVVALNPAARKLAAIADDEQLATLELSKLIESDREGGLQHGALQAAETGTFQARSGFFVRSAGQKLVDVSVKLRSLGDGRGIVILRDRSDQPALRQQLEEIAAGTAGVTGADFFPTLCRHLAESLGVRIAMVSAVEGESGETLRIIGGWVDGAPAPLLTCPVEGAPCQQSMMHGEFSCRQGLLDAFPDCGPVLALNADCFSSVAITNTSGKPLGNLCVLDDTPFLDEGRLKSLLRIFAARAGAELERQRSEERLQRSRERYALALKATSDAIWDWDLASGSVWTSARGMELLGHEPTDQTWTSAEWQALLHPDEYDFVHEEINRHFRDGTPYDVEIRMKNADGAFRWFRSCGTAVRDESGQPARVIGSFSDITDRRNARIELQAREQLYRNAITAADSVVYQIDFATDTYAYIGEGIAELRGYSADEFTPAIARSTVLQCVFEGECEGLSRDEAFRLLRAGKVQKWLCSKECLRPDGSKVWLSDSSVPLRNETGEAIGCLGIASDITRQKQAEQKLLSSEAMFRSLAESSPALVAILQGTQTRYMNPQFTALLGYSQNELLQRSFLELIHPDDRRLVADRSAARQRGEDVVSRYEMRLLTRTGETRWVDFSGCLVEFGGQPSVLGVALDITELKQTQNDLRRFFNQPLNLMAVVQLDGTVLKVNRACEEVLEHTSDDIVGQSYLKFIHPDDHERSLVELGRLASGESTVNFELQMTTSTGAIRNVVWSAVPDLPNDRFFANGLNITDRHQHRQLLRLQNEILEQAAAGTEQGKLLAAICLQVEAFVPDSKCAVVEFDPAARRPGYLAAPSIDASVRDALTEVQARFTQTGNGLSIVSAPRKTITHFTDESIDESVSSAMATIGVETCWIWPLDFESIRNASLVVMLPTRAEPDAVQRQLLDWTLSIIDIVIQRGKAERALRQSEQFAGKVLDSSLNGLYVYDVKEGNNVFINRQYTTLTGFTLDDLNRMSQGEFFSLFHPDDQTAVAAHIQAVLSADDGDIEELEYRFRTSDDRWIWCLSRDSVFSRADDGSVQRFIGSFLDVTERRSAEEETRRHRELLAHANRVSTLGEMATGLAHELNQPLAAIAMFAEASRTLMERDTIVPATFESVVKGISEQSMRAGAIVDRIRKFVGKEEFVPTECHVGDLIDSVLSFLHAELSDHAVKVETQGILPAASVHVDRVQIEQVLVNLLHNSVDAMSNTPVNQRKVTVSTTPVDSQFLEIAVTDFGPGMHGDEASRVFDAFYSTKEKGMGMGLAICRSIVETHGGRIVMESRPGDGARCAFTVPCSAGSES